MVPVGGATRCDARASGAPRRPGDTRYRHPFRRHGRVRRCRYPAVAKLVVRAVLACLWRDIRLGHGFAMARVRPRHGLQDEMEERRRLPDRELLHGAQSRGVALEPRAPPHGHHHRRARPGNPGHAPARPAAHSSQSVRHRRRHAGLAAHGWSTPPDTSMRTSRHSSPSARRRN